MSDHLGRFKFWSGDVNYVDYGGKWLWNAERDEWHMLELTNWEDQVGEREAKEIGYKYNVTLRVLYLGKVPRATLDAALHSCGWEEVDRGLSDKVLPDVQAGCLFDYGHGLAVWDKSSNNYKALLDHGKRKSKALAGDHSTLDRTYNRLGQTGEELLRGDMASALERGLKAGSQEASIVAQMYRASGGATIGGHIGDEVMEVVNRHE